MNTLHTSLVDRRVNAVRMAYSAPWCSDGDWTIRGVYLTNTYSVQLIIEDMDSGELSESGLGNVQLSE